MENLEAIRFWKKNQQLSRISQSLEALLAKEANLLEFWNQTEVIQFTSSTNCILTPF